MKKLTKTEKEYIAAKINNDGFEYYFIDYGPDEKLVSVIGGEIETYRKARYALIGALRAIGIDPNED